MQGQRTMEKHFPIQLTLHCLFILRSAWCMGTLLYSFENLSRTLLYTKYLPYRLLCAHIHKPRCPVMSFLSSRMRFARNIEKFDRNSHRAAVEQKKKHTHTALLPKHSSHVSVYNNIMWCKSIFIYIIHTDTRSNYDKMKVHHSSQYY